MTDRESIDSAASTPSDPSPEWAGIARGAASRLGGEDSEVQASEELHELLVFGLDGASYAISVGRVREIVRLNALTRIPRAPDWLLGVVALRGEVVEVIDLRRRLGVGASPPARTHRIVVLHGEGDCVTGLLVDSVSEVIRITLDQMLPAQGLDASHVSQVCLRGDEFVSILDVDRALGVNDV